MLQKPRGTRDFLPDEMERRRLIERRMRDAARRWGYREVCTPDFEHLELFTMKSGEGIIQEMYVFEDKGGRKMTLRPEVTAAVLRMYVNEGKVLPKPLRWCYFADCFRYERPQKGRYRQFWQFGVELIGADTASADAEVIMLADDTLRSTGVTFDLHVGHLAPMKHLLSGLDPGDQRAIMAYLDKHDQKGLEAVLFGKNLTHLAEPLAALGECRTVSEVFEVAGDVPERARIEETFTLLESQEIDYRPDFGIARGLDYYTGMVFEGFAKNLGAENQILGGGTYRLAHLFGGDDVASCGFAIGFDRVMVSIGDFELAHEPVVGVVCTPEGRARALEVARAFREAGVRAEADLMQRGMGAQVSHAAKTADFAAVLGKREVEAGTVTLKNLHSGEQQERSLEEAIAEVARHGAC
ncbi:MULTISPECIES: histidine--tRNA ligase [Methanoculleus]|uniref:Histidine--tRNA ligase n=2 Tax=Methanoculleus TaxID=45989 RepID=SYH_METMJ|nr:MULTISPECIES: histidine--tRNA ligase [Methanoculleus]A3CVW4.1 RecName: Full=Histidine--tRNA ligase; AltName: Full=Histidyl-tRNA synthetase; Short=HisRS [Methanoculleus marisnigri JR1]ABN57514.1 histidyl-tRNA synthetase [Methanoculleus marisnigri JR1]MCC7554863.1 histidine--tRNA ligase [Methanoculleus marisnigri]UYU18918.1 histidine--tRNA ligase [Methanoculleus submarinus]